MTGPPPIYFSTPPHASFNSAFDAFYLGLIVSSLSYVRAWGHFVLAFVLQLIARAG